MKLEELTRRDLELLSAFSAWVVEVSGANAESTGRSFAGACIEMMAQFIAACPKTNPLSNVTEGAIRALISATLEDLEDEGEVAA